MPDEINCNGECSWAWVKQVGHWNYIQENSSCVIYCSCEEPEITGEFDGQIVFTPCQPPIDTSQRIGESEEEYSNRLRSIRSQQ